MRLYSTEPSKNRDFSCPSWVAKEKVFKDYLRDRWVRRQGGSHDPFDRIRLWKSCVQKATKHYFKSRASETRSYSNTAAGVSRALRLLRLVRAERQDEAAIRRMFDADYGLRQRVTWDADANRWLETTLTQFIHNLLMDLTPAKDQSIHDELFGESVTKVRKESPIEALKKLIPCTRTRMQAIREDEASEPTNDPNEMAEIIERHWAPLWAKRERTCHLATAVELFGYDKKVVE